MEPQITTNQLAEIITSGFAVVGERIDELALETNRRMDRIEEVVVDTNRRIDQFIIPMLEAHEGRIKTLEKTAFA